MIKKYKRIIICSAGIIFTLYMTSHAATTFGVVFLEVTADELQPETSEITSADEDFVPIETRRELLFPVALGIIILLGIIMYVFIILPQRKMHKIYSENIDKNE